MTGGDYVIVVALALLVVLDVYALYRASSSRGPAVTRAQLSWQMLGGTFGAIFAALVFAIVNSNFSGLVNDALYLVAFLGVAYLCFENAWFQNKLIGFQSRWMARTRSP